MYFKIMDNKDKIIVHKVEIGFDINEEIMNELNSKIDETVLKDAAEIIDKLNDNPAIKKKEEENELNAKLKEICDLITANKKINKEEILKLSGLSNLTSAVGRLRNFALKSVNQKLIKIGKDDYGFEGC